jgi:hypothetical protein
MKSFFCFIALALSVSFVNAQSNKEDIAIIQGIFGKEKKALVAEYMTLTPEKQATFWTQYDQYETERAALGRERIALIEDYANSYATMDDAKANELAKRKLAWLNNFTKLQKKYYSLMAKSIGGKDAAKFMQLEDYIENQIRLSVQESIPFIDEIKTR